MREVGREVTGLNPQQQAVVTSTAHETLVIAAPGSGKTTVLVHRIEHLIWLGMDPQKIVVLSYSNAAASELRFRLRAKKLDIAFIGTLHAYCMRLLREHGPLIGYRKKGQITIAHEEISRELLLATRKRLGGEKKVSEKALEEQRTPDAVRIVNEYRRELKRANMVDYDGILTETRTLLETHSFARPKVEALLVDEIQDSQEVDWAIYDLIPGQKTLVGDPDQCQPAETMVQMSDGSEKPIFTIQSGDSVITYERHGKVLVKNGRVGQVASRYYRGLMYSISAGGNTSRSTGNHRWLIRWLSGSERSGVKLWATYIMRKGDYFRVGTTQFFRSGSGDGDVLGPHLRMRQEEADAIWVLKLHKTNTHAVAYEDIISCTYGLSEACFLPDVKSTNYTQATIDLIFSSIPKQLSKAVRCLTDHGRDINHPLASKSDKRTRRTVQEIRACNLLSEVMKVPRVGTYHYSTRHGAWEEISVTHYEFSGVVYSLDVDKHHKYVADGLVTCNSCYGFRGAQPALFIERSNRTAATVFRLERNYRSDAQIAQAANSLIARNEKRLPKVINPESQELGKIEMTHLDVSRDETMFIIRRMREAQKRGIPFEEMAVLARTNEIVDSMRKTMIEMNLPVQSAATITLPADWDFCLTTVQLMMDPANNLLTERYLKGIGMSLPQINRWKIEAMKTGTAMHTLAKLPPWMPEVGTLGVELTKAGVSPESAGLVLSRINELPMPFPTVSDVLADLWQPKDWRKDNQNKDGVNCSTIHGFKGKEADIVFIAGCEDGVFPSLSKTSDLSEERRLFFIAITRARHELYITHCSNRFQYGKMTQRQPSRFIEEMNLHQFSISRGCTT